MKTNKSIRLLQVVPMARLLGLSPGWLRMEARAGRLPHVDAGGTILFDVDAVLAVLAKRARDAKEAGR
jgi:hypothetical protein